MLGSAVRLCLVAYCILASHFQLWSAPADTVVTRLVEHCYANADGSKPFTVPLAALSSDNDRASLPIGVFDSGVGGLTVLESLLQLDAYHNDTLAPGPDGRPDFANERFIYFGDQANMPYGNYSAAARTDYLRELILKDALFLLGNRYHVDPSQAPRHDKPSVKALVIACNTATAYGLEDVRSLISSLKIPVVVVGVVEAGARGLLQAPDEGAVGVLATVGTCASEAYPRSIQSVRGRAGRSPALITQHGSPALAGVIEGDSAFPQSIHEQITADVTALARTHRDSGATQPLAKIVLGCTHFPLVQPQMKAAFLALRQDPAWADHIAPDLHFVDPAEWTARELFRELATARLRRPLTTSSQPLPDDQFFLSVPQPNSEGIRLTEQGTLDSDYKYTRQPGELTREDTVNVPLTLSRLPAAGRRLIETRLPRVWHRLSTAAARWEK